MDVIEHLLCAGTMVLFLIGIYNALKEIKKIYLQSIEYMTIANNLSFTLNTFIDACNDTDFSFPEWEEYIYSLTKAKVHHVLRIVHYSIVPIYEARLTVNGISLKIVSTGIVKHA